MLQFKKLAKRCDIPAWSRCGRCGEVRRREHRRRRRGVLVLSVLLGWAFAYLRDNPEARIIVHPPGVSPQR